MLRAAAAAGVERFVYISSVAVYGLNRAPLIDESMPTPPVGQLYPDSKIAAEAIVRGSGLPYVIVRPASTYGPRGDAWTLGPIRQIRAGNLVLLGRDDGLVTPGYIDNVVDGLVLALTHPAAPGEAFNLCDDRAVTYREFYMAYARMLGRDRLPTVPAWTAGLVRTRARALGAPPPRPPRGRAVVRPLPPATRRSSASRRRRACSATGRPCPLRRGCGARSAGCETRDIWIEACVSIILNTCVCIWRRWGAGSTMPRWPSLAAGCSSAGHELAASADEAEVCVLNSCAVTGEAAAQEPPVGPPARAGQPRRAVDRDRLLRDARGRVGLDPAQCAPGRRQRSQGRPDRPDRRSAAPALSPSEAHVSASAAGGRHGRAAGARAAPDRTRAFVKVQDGCHNHCTFCIVTVARGEERSRSVARGGRRGQCAAGR